MKKPLISVLIPAYNVEKYVRESINSIIKQTYSNIEIIIINDGSTDSTKNILEEISLTDHRIRLINNEKNLGVVKSLNKAISLAHGEYIARADADDISNPDWLEKILETLLNNPQIMACGSYLSVLKGDNANPILGKIYHNGEIWKFPTEHFDIIRTLPFYNCFGQNSMVIHADVFKKYDLKYNEEYIHAEDYKLWVDISKIGKLANIPYPLVHYRIHETNTSYLHNVLQNETARKIKREAIDNFLCKLGIQENIIDGIYFSKLNSILNTSTNILDENDKKTLSKILYNCFLSLDNYKFIDLLRLLLNKNKHILPFRKRVKIIKKYLRPYKYNKVL